MTLLAVEGLVKTFGGVAAVDGVGFLLAEGEMVALIGPNGAGKSTCFNMLGGQLVPDAGTIRFQGRDITRLPPRDRWRLGIGRTFQITATFGSMTVAENLQVALASRRRGLLSFGRLGGRDEARALLEQVGMADQADRTCGLLAYGDLKRVELAVALANQPRLLLMDEPTAGMAPRERGELMTLTAELCTRNRVGVLFTEHDMDVVFGHADRVLVMSRGKLIAQGNPGQVRADERVRQIYLGAGE